MISTLGFLLFAGAALLLVTLPFLLLRLRTLLWLVAALTTLVAGLIVYYFRIDSAMWLPYVAAIGLFGRYVVQIATSTSVPRDGRGWSAPGLLILIFIGFVLATSVANGVPAAQFLAGLKNYLAMWLVAVVVAALPNVGGYLSSFEKGAVVLSIVQVPFVLQQAYSTTNWDAVVGTFGGDPDGSGASGILMVFAIIGILAAINLWQTRRLGLICLALVIGLNIVVVGLAEVKAFFLLFPLALLVQQWRNVRRRPLLFVTLMAGAMLIVYFLIGFYEQLYLARSPGRVQLSAVDSVERSFAYFFDLNGVNFITGEVSRGASINLWLNDSGTGLIQRLVGYGAGASRPRSTIAIGEVAMRFAPLNISATSLSQLLWDTGVIGAALFALVLLSAVRLAGRLARRASSELLRSQLQTVMALLTMLVPFLIYDRSLVDQPTMQLLLAVIVGFLIALHRGVATAAPIQSRRILSMDNGAMRRRAVVT